MQQIAAFLQSLDGVQWLSRAGTPCEGAISVLTVAEGYDADKDVWSAHTHSLEEKAKAMIGDAAIDSVFDAVSTWVQEPLWQSVCSYFERRRREDADYDPENMDMGLHPELMDSVKRDLCWAAIEFLLGRADFFTDLLYWYRRGHWPCTWEGEYPLGLIVVL